MKKTRGRPRKYDEDKVLQAAEHVFWRKGFSDTSLEDLAVAMDMNRPSIYRAFGDKETIYRRVLMKFCQKMEAAFEQTMVSNKNIRQRLTSFYRGALEVYTAGDQAKGCMVMSTAVAAATCHPGIQSDLLNVIHALDKNFAEQFKQATKLGEMGSSISAEARAAVAQSLLHSLSLRARAGETPGQLTALIESGVEIITA
jgi:AcrR family transcriptional regulator